MAPDSTTPTVTSTGTVLADRYRLDRLIARGGMAEVFEAHDDLLDRRVAVKVFRAAEAAHRERFDAEVRLLAGLNHPGLVAVYDAGEHAGDGFMVLELVEGPTLRDVLADRAPLPDREVAGLGATLADALAHVHERGIVHRDLTPANVLCGTDGNPRLTDFGIARLLDTTRVTAEHLTIGTAGYMAPEQVEGGDVTPAADVYALGLVLLEALTAQRAFAGPSHEAAIARLTRDPAVPSELPDPWPALLGAMTARDPLERPAASEVAEALSPPVGLRRGPSSRRAAAAAVVVPAVGQRADHDAATQALPVAETGPPPTTAARDPEPTSVLPAALRPEEDGEHEDVGPGPSLGAGMGAASAGIGTRVMARARQVTPLQWMAVVLVLVLVLAVRAGASSTWDEDVAALRTAAAEADAAATSTTLPPSTTVAPSPTPPPDGAQGGAPAKEEPAKKEKGGGKKGKR